METKIINISAAVNRVKTNKQIIESIKNRIKFLMQMINIPIQYTQDINYLFPQPYNKRDKTSIVEDIKDSTEIKKPSTISLVDYGSVTHDSFFELVTSTSLMRQWKDNSYKDLRKKIAYKTLYIYQNWILENKIIGSLSYVGGGKVGHIKLDPGSALFYVVNSHSKKIILVGIGLHKDKKDPYYSASQNNNIFSIYKEEHIREMYTDATGIKQLLSTELIKDYTLDQAITSFTESFTINKKKTKVNTSKLEDSLSITKSYLMASAKQATQEFTEVFWDEFDDNSRLTELKDYVAQLINPEIASLENETIENELQTEINDYISKFYQNVLQEKNKDKINADNVGTVIEYPQVTIDKNQKHTLELVEKSITDAVNILVAWGVLNQDGKEQVEAGLNQWKIDFRTPYYLTGEVETFNTALRTLKNIRANINTLVSLINDRNSKIIEDSCTMGNTILETIEAEIPVEWQKTNIIDQLSSKLKQIKNLSLQKIYESTIYDLKSIPEKNFFYSCVKSLLEYLDELSQIITIKNSFDTLKRKGVLYNLEIGSIIIAPVEQEHTTLVNLIESLQKNIDIYTTLIKHKEIDYLNDVAKKMNILNDSIQGMLQDMQHRFETTSQDLSEAASLESPLIKNFLRTLIKYRGSLLKEIDKTKFNKARLPLRKLLDEIKVLGVLSTQGPNGLNNTLSDFIIKITEQRKQLHQLLELTYICDENHEKVRENRIRAFKHLIVQSMGVIDISSKSFKSLLLISTLVNSKEFKKLGNIAQYVDVSDSKNLNEDPIIDFNIPYIKLFLPNINAHNKIYEINEWLKTVEKQEVVPDLQSSFEELIEKLKKMDIESQSLTKNFKIKTLEELTKIIDQTQEKQNKAADKPDIL